MDFLQSIKFAWRSIRGKRGRSILTILSIFIGIAAVMTIVSVMEGMKAYTKEMYSAMGSNKITVDIYSWMYDEMGNPVGGKDYFPELETFCKSIPDLVSGISPQGYCNATAVYGTKSSANMDYSFDEEGNLLSAPPNIYYGSDQYAVCNNLELAAGRDLAYLDIEKYNQVCVLGSDAVKSFFGSVNPIGKKMQFNGNNFEVVGVYKSRTTSSNGSRSNIDNFILIPYTANRVLGGEQINTFYVKAKDSSVLNQAISKLGGYVKGLVNPATGGYSVYSESSWQESENEYLTTIGLILGGIAAISLLVGGIGIMNMMLVTVTERTREIGIRRAIGATQKSIVVQFLVEAGMLCGIGGLIGIVIGYIGSVVLGRAVLQMTLFPPLWVTLATFAFSVSLGLLFGCYPAIKASKLQPVEALRAE
ncbi:MAG: ABC transporter permease [Bacillota bacterium]|nr:ABC transporter permease [Bacillota bacterium]